MILRAKMVLGAVLVGLVLVAGAGSGQAAAHGKGHGQGLLLNTAAGYIGVTKKVLVTDLRTGQTLAQVATARGRSVDGLKAALVSALRAKVDAAVAAGKKNAAQAQARLARIQAFVDRFVNRSFAAKTFRPFVGRGLLRLAAAYIGIAPKALATELRGNSLAGIATAHGKSIDGLEAALIAPFKAKLDRAVAAGRVSTTSAQAALAKIAARIDKIVKKVH